MELNPERALAVLTQSMELFNVHWPVTVKFDCDNFKPDVVAYYNPNIKTLCFRSNYIPDQTVYHEFFHMLGHYYSYDEDTEESAEAWARIGESVWMRTEGEILNFECEVCHQKPSRITMLSSGEWSCNYCNSVYGLDFA